MSKKTAECLPEFQCVAVTKKKSWNISIQNQRGKGGFPPESIASLLGVFCGVFGGGGEVAAGT